MFLCLNKMQLQTLVALLLLFCMSCKATNKICHDMLHNLADKQQHFVFCTTTNAVPVTICLSCALDYWRSVDEYNLLHKDGNCSYMFNQDRVQVVTTTQNAVKDLWNKAYCDDCFKSNNSDTFYEKNNAVQSCFAEEKENMCLKCFQHYQDLNNFYINLDKNNNGKICYDLQDSMNRTRATWSKENCCQREIKLTLFYVVGTWILIQPLIFYFVAYRLGKRRERLEVQPHIVAEPDLHQQQQDVVPSTSQSARDSNALLTAAQPTGHSEPLSKPITNDATTDADSNYSDSDESIAHTPAAKLKGL